MKTTKNFPTIFLTYFFALSFLFFVGSACSSDEPETAVEEQQQESEEEEPEDETQDLTFSTIFARGSLPQYQQGRTIDTTASQTIGTKEYSELLNGNPETVRYACDDTTIAESNGSTIFPVYNSDSQVIFPGSFIQGKTLSNVALQSIPLKRAGGALVLEKTDGSLVASTDVDEFSRSKVIDATQQIIASNDLSISELSIELIPIYSNQQLALNLDVNELEFEAEIAQHFPNVEDGSNRFLIRIEQPFYAVGFDLPTSTDELFSSEVEPDDLDPHVADDNPAAFISEMVYGRRFYILLETLSSNVFAREQLEMAFTDFETGSSGELNTAPLLELESSTYRVIAQSANASGAFEQKGEIALNELSEILNTEANITSAQPLSYEVRSINSPDTKAGFTLTSEYNAVVCKKEGALPPAGFLPLVNLFEDGVGAAALVRRGDILVFNKAGTEYVWLNTVTGQASPKYNIKDPNGLLGELQANSISAAYSHVVQRIYLFDETGAKFEIYRHNQLDVGFNEIPTGPFGELGTDGSGAPLHIDINPFFTFETAAGMEVLFLETGYEAALYMGLRTDFDSSTQMSTFLSLDHRFFEKGKSYLTADEDYLSENGTTTRNWSQITNINEKEEIIFPFETIGAACGLELEFWTFTQVYFNGEGNKFFIADENNGLVQGPYLLY